MRLVGEFESLLDVLEASQDLRGDTRRWLSEWAIVDTSDGRKGARQVPELFDVDVLAFQRVKYLLK